MRMKLLMAVIAGLAVMGCSEDNDVVVPGAEEENNGGVEAVEPLPAELRPVLTLGKRWITEYTYSDREVKEIRETEVVGDTVVDGLGANIVSITYGSGATVRDGQREEGSTVYKLWRTSTTYPLEYDFFVAYDVWPEVEIIKSPISTASIVVSDLGTSDNRRVKTKRGVVVATSPRLDNKPIIITFLAMEKVILLFII